MGAPDSSRTAADSWRDIPSPRVSLVGVTTMLAGVGGDVGSSEPHAATIAPTATLDRREHSTARGLLIRPSARLPKARFHLAVWQVAGRMSAPCPHSSSRRSASFFWPGTDAAGRARVSARAGIDAGHLPGRRPCVQRWGGGWAVHICALLAHVLGLRPAPNDGRLDSVRSAGRAGRRGPADA